MQDKGVPVEALGEYSGFKLKQRKTAGDQNAARQNHVKLKPPPFISRMPRKPLRKRAGRTRKIEVEITSLTA
jgi:hypothetical protein